MNVQQMADSKTILAIPGSTRQNSSNLSLIKAIAELYADKINIKLFRELSSIPHFNPDLECTGLPAIVFDFRNQIQKADGVLICTPEYAMGVPGTLKNAIDWTVSSLVFSHKPVALITASTAGEKAHRSLLDTLKVIESIIPDTSQLLISHVKTKIDDDRITDRDTLEMVKKLVDSLIHTIDTGTLS